MCLCMSAQPPRRSVEAVPESNAAAARPAKRVKVVVAAPTSARQAKGQAKAPVKLVTKVKEAERPGAAAFFGQPRAPATKVKDAEAAAGQPTARR